MVLNKRRPPSQRQAHIAVKAHLERKGYFVIELYAWARWLDLPRPQWSVWASVVSRETGNHLTLGIQIFDDGEPVIVTRLLGTLDPSDRDKEEEGT